VTRLKRASEILVLFVVFPVAVFMTVGVAMAVTLSGLVAYVGALLAAWLLFAFVFPLATGIMTPGEIVSSIRSRRARRFEGEPLPEDRLLAREPWIPALADDSPRHGQRPSRQTSRPLSERT
jgi:hypothetical protein